ncbi:MAG: thioesterase family protein [Deltaproteobacteria bacterium]|nr:thioesterase family protein [Deltaproteobacteria bacterium]
MSSTLRSGPANFQTDTRIDPGDRPGHYRCSLSGRWSTPLFPFGGVVSAIGLRAIMRELDHPTHQIRSATTVYSSAVAEGELDIEIQPLRVGKRMSQLLARVRNVGSDDAGHTTEAREGFEFTAASRPEAKPPEECPPPEEPPSAGDRWQAPFFEQIETRMVLGHPPWKDDWSGGRAEYIRWMRFLVPPFLESGELDPLALVALTDTMPPAVTQYLGPGAPMFFAPSCDLTVHVFGSTRGEWVLVQVTCSRAGDGYASARARIWDRQGALLVEATQLMYLRLGGPGDLAP